MSTDQVIATLQTARVALESALTAPLCLENYREDISEECDVAVHLLKELKETELRKEQLVAKREEVKDLPNKVKDSSHNIFSCSASWFTNLLAPLSLSHS